MQEEFMLEAIRLSKEWMDSDAGWPFWAVIVKDWKIVWKWYNRVTSTNDPTAHGEVVAIRDACENLNTFELDWCEIYTSCEPCPMCLWAIYWAHIEKVYYGNTEKDAANIGFDDQFIYQEMDKPISQRKLKMEQLMRDEAQETFVKRIEKQDRIEY